jgi:hypothetical protein
MASMTVVAVDRHGLSGYCAISPGISPMSPPRPESVRPEEQVARDATAIRRTSAARGARPGVGHDRLQHRTPRTSGDFPQCGNLPALPSCLLESGVVALRAARTPSGPTRPTRWAPIPRARSRSVQAVMGIAPEQHRAGPDGLVARWAGTLAKLVGPNSHHQERLEDGAHRAMSPLRPYGERSPGVTATPGDLP